MSVIKEKTPLKQIPTKLSRPQADSNCGGARVNH